MSRLFYVSFWAPKYFEAEAFSVVTQRKNIGEYSPVALKFRRNSDSCSTIGGRFKYLLSN